MLEESVNHAKVRGEFATKIREDCLVNMRSDTEEKRRSFIRVSGQPFPPFFLPFS